MSIVIALSIMFVVVCVIFSIIVISWMKEVNKDFEKFTNDLRLTKRKLENKIESLENFKAQLINNFGIEVETIGYPSLTFTDYEVIESNAYELTRWESLLKHLELEWEEKKTKGFVKIKKPQNNANPKKIL